MNTFVDRLMRKFDAAANMDWWLTGRTQPIDRVRWLVQTTGLSEREKVRKTKTRSVTYPLSLSMPIVS
jgi:hypothetical protein